MNVSLVAQAWRESAVSTVPILPNGTKRPAVKWSEYQVTLPTVDQVQRWWGNGQEYGLALVCGRVSGNLEMLELEGRACDSSSLTKVLDEVRRSGSEDVWALLNGPDGYSEWSPSGGLHLLYRIVDHEVPGNAKIAQAEDLLCLAETRGEGGYVVVAPTSGQCHPTGEAWALIQGQYGRLPEITWDQRNRLHTALRDALDARPPVVVEHPSPPVPSLAASPDARGGTGVLPGEDFAERTDWADILAPHGWQLESTRASGERHWTRPGKSVREGNSATTGHVKGLDRFYVFSTSTQFEALRTHTKFYVYAHLNHGGDMNRAAVALFRQGYGTVPETPPPRSRDLDVYRPTFEGAEGEDPGYPNNDDGNALYLRDAVNGLFRYVTEEKCFVRWNGRTWEPDVRNTLELEFKVMARRKYAEAVAANDEAGVKRWLAAGNSAKIEGALKRFKSEAGVPILASELNPNRHLLNVGNGVLDLDTGVLTEHDPKYLMTRMFGASYDPGATCPQFEKFMADVLPDPSVRAYVQRALGYTLLGDVDQRAMFLVYGPSGTGKSTLMETMRHVFGDYGATAAPGTFRAPSRESAPTNDLHDLRGKRFVTTSETAETANFNEDLLKRLTGRDRVRSRELYQSNQEWTPECSLWLATNHPPRFNSDDDAIWRRTKLVPFLTRFLGDQEVTDLARSYLAPEADGILNWLLVGLAHYQAIGLSEPETVEQAAEEQRLQSDSVARFLDDRTSEGVLVRAEDQSVKMSELHSMYLEWSRQVGERGLGSRRFANRLQGHPYGIEPVRSDGRYVWRGVGRANGVSVLGTLWGVREPTDED